jgi:hypothetical protein
LQKTWRGLLNTGSYGKVARPRRGSKYFDRAGMFGGRMLEPKNNLSSGLFDRMEIYVTMWWFVDVSIGAVRLI